MRSQSRLDALEKIAKMAKKDPNMKIIYAADMKEGEIIPDNAMIITFVESTNA